MAHVIDKRCEKQRKEKFDKGYAGCNLVLFFISSPLQHCYFVNIVFLDVVFGCLGDENKFKLRRIFMKVGYIFWGTRKKLD